MSACAAACWGLAARRRLRVLAATVCGAKRIAGVAPLLAFGRKKAEASVKSAPASSRGRSLSSASGYREKLQKHAQPEPPGGFVDTHCHLDMILPRLERQHRSEAQKARKAGGEPQAFTPGFEGWRAALQGPMKGFVGCVHVGCSADSLDAGVAFLKHEGVHGAFGIHPLVAEDWTEQVEEQIWGLMAHEKVVAWGECGLDYYDKDMRGQLQDREVIERQRKVFSRQMQLAAKASKPLVVHTREAEEDTLELMREYLPRSHPVHVHCFTSSQWLAKKLLEDFPKLCLGFTGVVTFRNAEEVRKVVQRTPLDRILLETDGPYMAPEPFRGSVAHPGHVAYVAERIAKIKGVSTEEVLKACRENTRRVYGF